jgi:hypothetical protein
VGTNYFVRPEGACSVRCDQWVHLGKSSHGWRFTHQAFRSPDIDGPEAVTWPVVDRESWLRLLDLGEIYDEYGEAQDRTEFLALIDGKQELQGHKAGQYGSFVVGGFDFCDRWFS